MPDHVGVRFADRDAYLAALAALPWYDPGPSVAALVEAAPAWAGWCHAAGGRLEAIYL